MRIWTFQRRWSCLLFLASPYLLKRSPGEVRGHAATSQIGSDLLVKPHIAGAGVKSEPPTWPALSSEFRIRIQAKVLDPTHIISVYLEIVKNHLKFIHKEESINYLPFSFSHSSPAVHRVQNSQRNNIFIYLLFHILLDPDPCGSRSTTLHILIQKNGVKLHFCQIASSIRQRWWDVVKNIVWVKNLLIILKTETRCILKVALTRTAHILPKT